MNKNKNVSFGGVLGMKKRQKQVVGEAPQAPLVGAGGVLLYADDPKLSIYWDGINSDKRGVMSDITPPLTGGSTADLHR